MFPVEGPCYADKMKVRRKARNNLKLGDKIDISAGTNHDFKEIRVMSFGTSSAVVVSSWKSTVSNRCP